MAYPTVVMESLVSRDLHAIDTKWSTPQLLEALLRALTGDGPALSTTPLSNSVSPEIALVVTTSGSTGTPKSVALSARALIANARATHEFIGASVGDRWSLLLPTTHIAGLNVLIRSIELGTIPVSVDNTADFTAIVPTQLHRALATDTKLFSHLKGCRAILVGGAPLSEETRNLATARGLNIIIISGGEKISLSAVESYLQSEFANQEIVAFAKADPEWGEKLCIATTAALSIEAVASKLKTKFGSHASPKEVHTVSNIPYLSIGKPDRKRLANDFA